MANDDGHYNTTMIVGLYIQQRLDSRAEMLLWPRYFSGDDWLEMATKRLEMHLYEVVTHFAPAMETTRQFSERASERPNTYVTIFYRNTVQV